MFDVKMRKGGGVRVKLVFFLLVFDLKGGGGCFGMFLYRRLVGKERKDAGKLVFVQKVGRGSFGTVWSCREEGGESLLAVKIVRFERASEEEVDLVQKESVLWPSLVHENVVRLFWTERMEGEMRFVCELMEESLRSRIDRKKKEGEVPSLPESVSQLAQAASGLSYLHSLSVVHRDVKAANLLVKGKRVALSDFGLARLVGTGMTAETGSYRWMAPEVVRHEPYTEACDVYSLGITAVEVVAWEMPFPSKTPVQAALGAATKGERPYFPPPPHPLSSLITSFWQDDPHLRPTSLQATTSLLTIKKSI